MNDHRYKNQRTIGVVAPTFKQARMVAAALQPFMCEQIHARSLSRPENLMGVMSALLLIVFHHKDMTADQKHNLRMVWRQNPEWQVMFMSSLPFDSFPSVEV